MLRDEERFSELLAEAEEDYGGIIARLDEGERLVEEAKQAIWINRILIGFKNQA